MLHHIKSSISYCFLPVLFHLCCLPQPLYRSALLTLSFAPLLYHSFERSTIHLYQGYAQPCGQWFMLCSMRLKRNFKQLALLYSICYRYDRVSVYPLQCCTLGPNLWKTPSSSHYLENLLNAESSPFSLGRLLMKGMPQKAVSFVIQWSVHRFSQ